MKQFILLVISLLTSTFILAQSQIHPSRNLNYQAAIRDNSGKLLDKKNISLRFSLYRDTLPTKDTLAYRELHNVKTNEFGLVNLIIGKGTSTWGNFDTLDWKNPYRFIRVDLDADGGLLFKKMGYIQLQSVPYANVAREVMKLPAIKLNDLSDVNTSGAITGKVLKFNGSEWIPADDNTASAGGGGVAVGSSMSGNGTSASPLNIAQQGAATGQVLKWNGSAWSPSTDIGGTAYSAGTGISISGSTISNTGDVSNTNEIQNLSLTGTTLSLSNGGGSVTLPTGTTYSAGTGISISGSTISNTGDTNSSDDITTSSVAAGDVTGNFSALSVQKIQGRPVSNAAPSTNQILKWNGTIWAPADDATSGGGSGGTYNAGTGISIAGSTINNTGDLSNTNEIQTLSITGSGASYNLALSNGGGTVALPTEHWIENGANNIISSNSGKVSIGVGASVSVPAKLEVKSAISDGISAKVINDNYGVVGDAINGVGVYGVSSSASGVRGYSTSGIGVSGICSLNTGFGGFFSNVANGPALITETGNVGIGALTPTAKLDIDGQIRIRGGSPGVGKVLTSSADGTATWATPSSGGASQWTTNGTNIHYNSGSVGIGVGSPQNKLHIHEQNFQNCGIKFTHLNSGSGADDGARVGLFGNDLDLVNFEPGGFFNFINSASDNVFNISSTGNVGIGIGFSAASAKLEVNGQVKIRGGVPGAGKVLTSDASGLASWETPVSGGASQWITSGSNVYYNTGDIGIGTSIPNNNLHILKGSFAAANIETTSNSGASHLYLNNLGSVLDIAKYGASASGSIQNILLSNLSVIDARSSGSLLLAANNELHVGTNGDVRLTVNSAGNLGIGNLIPSEKLTLSNGRIFFTGNTITGGQIATIEKTSIATFEVGGNWLSNSDGFDNLGSSFKRWNTVFASNGTINTSDRREKKNIQVLNYGLNEVMKLKPVTFEWKNRSEQGRKIGFIAQDLQEVVREVVVDKEYTRNEKNEIESKEATRLGVYYSDLIPVLTKAIQEQQAIISQQQTAIEALLKRVEALEQKK